MDSEFLRPLRRLWNGVKKVTDRGWNIFFLLLGIVIGFLLALRMGLGP